MHLRCIDVAVKEATEEDDVGCFKVYSMHFVCVCVLISEYLCLFDYNQKGFLIYSRRKWYKLVQFTCKYDTLWYVFHVFCHLTFFTDVAQSTTDWFPAFTHWKLFWRERSLQVFLWNILPVPQIVGITISSHCFYHRCKRVRQTVFVFGFSGVGLNAGAYGGILAGCECTCGRYPVTLSFLKLVSNMVQVCFIFYIIFRCTYIIGSS